MWLGNCYGELIEISDSLSPTHTKRALPMKACSLALGLLFVLATFTSLQAQDSLNFPTIGEVERMSPRLDSLIAEDAKIEVLGAGFIWSEGPVWVPDETSNGGGYVLFSDIPRNSIMKWEEGVGVTLYLKPAGFTGVAEYGSEPGTNGLMLDAKGQLVMCEHGDRRVSVMTHHGGKMTIADAYEGKRLNSPNDLVFHSNGDLYFTDPPYGLPGRYASELRELDFCGVYRVTPEREVTLLTTEMTRPNGIAFSPDEKTLYVAQSDPQAAIWKSFPVNDDGTLGAGKLFFDATDKVGKEPGLPDGMAVDVEGNVFATGPGGVHVFTPDGELLGVIATGEKTANCTFGGKDNSVLFLTADTYLCRIQTKTKGFQTTFE